MVQVIPLHHISTNDRGTTWVFDNDRTGQFIVAYRKAGSANGRQYHTGKNPYKNPEMLVLMSGEATLNWRTIDGSQSGAVPVTAPAKIVIPVNIWHELVAITDFTMLELNSLEAGKDDTFSL